VRFHPMAMLAATTVLIALLGGGFLWRTSPWGAFLSAHAGNNAHVKSSPISLSPTSSAVDGVFPPSFAPLYKDSMTSPQTQARWHHGGTHCIFTPQGYVYTYPEVGYCNAEAKLFTDVAFDITMSLLKGLRAGIDFRAGDQSNLYAYTIGVTGDFLLEMVDPINNVVKILAQGNSPLIKPGYGQLNRLGVSAIGSTLRLYIDDHLVATVKDSTYPWGAVGVVVGSYTNHRANKDVVTVARYTDSEIWLLP